MKEAAYREIGDHLRFTEAGLLSIPVISASVESAIMSLLALESHSNTSSRSPVCLTSTAPMTCVPISPSTMRVEPDTKTCTHPDRRHAVAIDALLDLPEHALEVPAHELPAYVEHHLLALRDNICRQPREVAQVARIK